MLNPLRDFVAFDLETTGLERDADEIIEIGAVKIQNGQVAEKMSCLLKAEKPLSPLVISLTGITQAMLTESGQELRAGLERFLAFIQDLPLVAHNSDFDATFVGHALIKLSLPPLSNLVYDSLLLARVAWPTLDSHRLETLVEKLGIPVQAAHRALPDAEQAAALWILGQEKLAGYSPRTLSLIRQTLAAGPEPWRAFFGNSEASDQPLDLEDAAALMGLNKPAPIVENTSITTAATEHVEDLFLPGKELANAFTKLNREFKSRSRQARMAALVERSFEESRFLAVESEPGIGRMLACLISAVRQAVARRRPAFIAVYGRYRTEALVAFDFPILKALFGNGLRLEVLKSPSSYLSPKKFASVMAHPETRLRDEEKLALLPLITWLENTVDGDIGESMGFNQDRNRLLWSKLASDTYLTEPGSHAFAARERASRAHLVLIDHHLFFDDLSLDFALLPSYEGIVFDEAHRLIELGKEKLGREVNFFRLKFILQLLAFSKTESTGILAELERQASERVNLDEAGKVALARLREIVFEPERQFQKFFNKIAKHAQKRRKDGENRIRYTDKLVIEFGVGPEAVLASIFEIETILTQLGGLFAGLTQELRRVTDLLRSFTKDLEHLSHPPMVDSYDAVEGSIAASKEVYWIEDFPNPHRAMIRSVPLNISPVLAQKFLPQMDTVVFASAALALGEQFGFFTAQVGLDSFPDRLKTAMVHTKDKEAKPTPIFIAKFNPVLNNAAAAQVLSGVILRGLKQIVRPAFLLFTHIGMLKQIRGFLQEGLASDGRMVLAQHVDGSRESLLHLFRNRKDTVLLGTEAFTANLSINGTLPELIMVTKLPFPVPTEPITAANLEKIQAANGNVLYDYILPQSILRLKEELNRMPRHANRPQIVWILDPRPITEKYGTMYLRGLGREAIFCETEEELISKTLEALKPKAE